MREKVCQNCGVTFSVTAEQYARKFCCWSCKKEAQTKRRPVACPGCGVVKVRALADPHVHCVKCGHKNRAAKRRGMPVTHGPEWLASMKSKARNEKVSRAHTDRDKLTPRTRRGSPTHVKAVECFLRSPANVVYWVRNLAEFVRSHRELFHPDDLINKSRKQRTYGCNATHGLSSIIRQKNPRGQWKGWLRVSRAEYGERFDLIGRNYEPDVQSTLKAFKTIAENFTPPGYTRLHTQAL